jgi:hypothetical protein
MKSKLFLTGMAALLLSFGLVLTACEDLTKDSNPAVTGVTVTSSAATVAKGGTLQFTAEVNGTNNPPQTVAWSIEGTGKASDTTISGDGKLTVASGESSKTLTVRATSTFDTTKFGQANVTVTGNGSGDDDDDELSPDIDSALIGTWKDKPAVEGYGTPGDILTVTFTDTTVTWGGSAGETLNSSLSSYQAYGSFAWEVKNGSINLAYIHPTLGRQSYTCYTYVINGSGELELQTGGYTFVTLTKNGGNGNGDDDDTTPPADVSGLVGTPANGQVTLAWTDPADDDLASIEITFTPTAGGVTQPVSVAKAAQTTIITGLANETEYTFTVKAVDAAGNKSGGQTATATPSSVVNNIDDVGSYLTEASQDGAGANADNPISLTVSASLAGENWTALLSAIQGADKYVALDLSEAPMTGTEFDPGAANAGESKIVSLVLPDVATSIKGGDYENSAFKNFTALASVSGSAVETVGDYAFDGCTALTEVSLPEATSIGEDAFDDCAALTEVSLPKATSIGNYAFRWCAALTEVSLPEATSISGGALSGTALTEVSLPKATSIDGSAFNGCAALTTVSFPEATSIGSYAFRHCTALTEVSLPKATSISRNAFDSTGSTALAITLGNTPPTVGYGMFDWVNASKTVTVKVPSSAAASYDDAWQEAFKGRGNTGTTGTVNSNITLTIQGY